MAEIIIDVAGGPGSGKSAIAEQIRQALESVGVKVVMVDDNGYGVTDETHGVIAASLGSRLKALVEKDSSVIIRTKIKENWLRQQQGD